MTSPSDFDVDAVMKTLGTVSAKYPEGSPEAEALRVAAVALLFVRDTQALEAYRAYFRGFSTPKPVSIARTFASREDADAWLTSGDAREGDLVRVAGAGFVVLNALKGLKFVPMNLPE